MDVKAGKIEIPQRVLDRFWDRVDVRSSQECWPWKLRVGLHGYGTVGWWVAESNSSINTVAHRVAWLAAGNEIPGDLTIDHICRNRVCCNPSHLRLLPNAENARLNGPGVRACCARGHEYVDGSFSLTRSGWRSCLVCRRLRRRGELPEISQ